MGGARGCPRDAGSPGQDWSHPGDCLPGGGLVRRRPAHPQRLRQTEGEALQVHTVQDVPHLRLLHEDLVLWPGPLAVSRASGNEMANERWLHIYTSVGRRSAFLESSSYWVLKPRVYGSWQLDIIICAWLQVCTRTASEMGTTLLWRVDTRGGATPPTTCVAQASLTRRTRNKSWTGNDKFSWTQFFKEICVVSLNTILLRSTELFHPWGIFSMIDLFKIWVTFRNQFIYSNWATNFVEI